MLQSLTLQLLLVGKLFLLMGVGILLRKIGMITEEGKQLLSRLVLELILPCNIVCAFTGSALQERMQQFGVMLLIAIAIEAVSYALSFVLYRFCEKEHQTVLRYGTICSNSGALGTTVAQEIFGAEGALLATIYCTPLRIAMWSIGLSIFTNNGGKLSLKKTLTNPCIVAVIIGLFFMLSGCRIPTLIDNTLQSLAAGNTAMVLIMVGTLVADMDPRLLLHKEGWYFAFIRLIGLPLLVLAGCRLIGADPLICQISVILTAMPMGSTTPILAYRYGADSSFASAVTASTTVLSLIAVPIWCAVMA